MRINKVIAAALTGLNGRDILVYRDGCGDLGDKNLRCWLRVVAHNIRGLLAKENVAHCLELKIIIRWSVTAKLL